MIKYSPGPWEIDEQDHGFPTEIVSVGSKDSEDHHIVCTIWDEQPEAPSNANLISAAPDMLEALIKAFDGITTGFYGMSESDTIKVMRNAIAKARGGK